MKKSTLITTIAMIVVVVVALSTATYAWFSSATNSIAETSITTTASVDWLMVQGNVVAPATATTAPTATEATFTSAASESIQLTNIMTAGLFAPTAEIATAPSKDATSAISDLAIFYDAKTSQGQTTITTVGTVYDSISAEAGGDLTVGHNNIMKPDIIKVSNGVRDNKNLRLTVIVNAGPSVDSTATLYAAAATSFYANWVKVGDNTFKGKATNGYSYKSGATPATAFANNEYSTVAYNETGYVATQAKPSYANAANDARWSTQAGDLLPADAALGIGAGDKYLKYTVDIGAVNVGESVYVLLYTWIDGWVAEANAAGASFKVTYSFTSYTPAP